MTDPIVLYHAVTFAFGVGFGLLAREVWYRDCKEAVVQGYELIHREERHARTSHRCVWCGWMISKDTIYVREVAKIDGIFRDRDWHPACERRWQHRAGAAGHRNFEECQEERP